MTCQLSLSCAPAQAPMFTFGLTAVRLSMFTCSQALVMMCTSAGKADPEEKQHLQLFRHSQRSTLDLECITTLQ